MLYLRLLTKVEAIVGHTFYLRFKKAGSLRLIIRVLICNTIYHSKIVVIVFTLYIFFSILFSFFLNFARYNELKSQSVKLR